jgi:type III secretory pathway component EscU
LVSVVAYVLVLVGVSWIAAGLALAVIHLAVAYYLYRKALKLSRDLTLPSLRRALFTAEE